MIKASTLTTELSDSRATCAVSMMPESSYACETFRRMTAVRRSMASATTLGEGGSGTFCAKDRAEARGVRATARARAACGSASESSLESWSACHTKTDASYAATMEVTHVGVPVTAFVSSSAALVTRRFTDFTAFSPSDKALGASFFTGDDSERLL